MDKVRFEVIEGVVIEIDPTVWDVRGNPLALKPHTQPSVLSFDVTAISAGDHATSKLENMLSVTKVRR